MARLYPTKVRIAGTLSTTEATRQLVKAIARERLFSNGSQINDKTHAAKAIQAATDGGVFLELESAGARQGWHEHVEGICRHYDLSFEVKAYEKSGLLSRHVAYVGHLGYLEEKATWPERTANLRVMSFPRTSLRQMAQGEHEPD